MILFYTKIIKDLVQFNGVFYGVLYFLNMAWMHCLFSQYQMVKASLQKP